MRHFFDRWCLFLFDYKYDVVLLQYDIVNLLSDQLWDNDKTENDHQLIS